MCLAFLTIPWHKHIQTDRRMDILLFQHIVYVLCIAYHHTAMNVRSCSSPLYPNIIYIALPFFIHSIQQLYASTLASYRIDLPNDMRRSWQLTLSHDLCRQIFIWLCVTACPRSFVSLWVGYLWFLMSRKCCVRRASWLHRTVAVDRPNWSEWARSVCSRNPHPTPPRVTALIMLT